MTDPGVEEELASSRHGSLIRTADDYRVVRRGVTEVFPLTEDGSDNAWARYRSLTRLGRLDRGPSALLAVAAIAAGCWLTLVVLRSLVTGLTAWDTSSGSWIRTVFDLARFEQVFYALFIASLGCYIVWWLYRKGRVSGRT